MIAPLELLGVLGVGRMGLPIARRLVERGYSVLAFDPDPLRLAAAAAIGCRVAANARDVAAAADILITVLPGPNDCRDALLGDHGALTTVRPGSLWLDLTSNDPRVASTIAGHASSLGIAAVGAPMSGGPTAAERGELGFYLGGHPGAIDRVLPVLSALGPRENVSMLGADVGAGYTAKLLANTLWFGQAVAVTEVLLVGQAAGLDLATLRDTLAAGPGGSAFLSHDVDALLNGDYLETFPIDRVVEELDTVSELAAAAEVPFELSDVVRRLHREALERFGPVDGELLAARLLEERAGALLRAASSGHDTEETVIP